MSTLDLETNGAGKTTILSKLFVVIFPMASSVVKFFFQKSKITNLNNSENHLRRVIAISRLKIRRVFWSALTSNWRQSSRAIFKVISPVSWYSVV